MPETNAFFYKDIVRPEYLIGMMVLFIGIIILITVVILALLIRQVYQRNLRCKLGKELDELIGEIATCETPGEQADVLLKYSTALDAMIKRSFTAQLLIDKLAEACNQLSGTGQENIIVFFKQLNLHSHFDEGLKSPQWYTKSAAIQKIAALKIDAYLPEINKLVNSSNQHVRAEAQVAMIKLKGFAGLNILYHLKYPVSKWQQICLVDELHRHQFDSPVPILPLFQSPNVSILELAIKLYMTYQSDVLEQEVIKCLYHPSPSIRLKAIKALELEMKPYLVSLFIQQYSTAGTAEAFAILRAMANADPEDVLPFLCQELDNENPLLGEAAAAAMLKCTGRTYVLKSSLDPDSSICTLDDLSTTEMLCSL